MANVVCHKLWSWLPIGGITLGRHIFLKDLNDALTLEHELVHFKQQERDGVWFWIRYLLVLPIIWNKYRASYEAEAYAVQARAGCPIGGEDGLAKALSGPLYGWCCRRGTAAELIGSYAAKLPLTY